MRGNFEQIFGGDVDVAWLVQLCDGVPEMINWAERPPRSRTENYKSTTSPEVRHFIRTKIQQDLDRQHIWPNGHFGFHARTILALGAVEKHHFGQVVKGQWRIIIDASSPAGESPNDAMGEPPNFKFVRLEEICAALGRGKWMAVADLKEYYRFLFLRATDLVHFAFEFDEQVYLDGRMGFGGRKSPAIAQRLSDGICRVLNANGSNQTNSYKAFSYIDDFIIVADTQEACAAGLASFRRIIDTLGLEEATAKAQLPSQRARYLGIWLDTRAMSAQFDKERIVLVLNKLDEFLAESHHPIRKKSLQSLLGHLAHVSKLTPGARPHLHSLFSLLHSGRRSVRLNKPAREDLEFFRLWLPHYQGKEDLLRARPNLLRPVFTDASSSWGLGGHWGSEQFAFSWQELNWRPGDIVHGELLAWLVACLLWARRWQGKKVYFKIDSQLAIWAVSSGRLRGSKAGPLASHFAKLIVVALALTGSTAAVEYIRSEDNQLADDLSRGRYSSGVRATLEESGNPIPEALPDTNIWYLVVLRDTMNTGTFSGNILQKLVNPHPLS